MLIFNTTLFITNEQWRGAAAGWRWWVDYSTGEWKRRERTVWTFSLINCLVFLSIKMLINKSIYLYIYLSMIYHFRQDPTFKHRCCRGILKFISCCSVWPQIHRGATEMLWSYLLKPLQMHLSLSAGGDTVSHWALLSFRSHVSSNIQICPAWCA